MSRIALYIGAGFFVLLTIIFVAGYFFNIPLLRSIPGVSKIACQFPVTVSGNSMEPAINAGSRATFDKCSKNKDNLPAGTIILYSGEGGSTISRIKERIPNQDSFIYKVSQDNRPDAVFEVRQDRIIGVLEQ